MLGVAAPVQASDVPASPPELVAPEADHATPRTGTARVLFVRVNWTQPDALTEAGAQRMLSEANDYFRDASYGVFGLQGDVTPWLSIPNPRINEVECIISNIGDSANLAAESAGYDLSQYTNFVYYFPGNSDCGFWGTGGIGTNTAWINGLGIDPNSTPTSAELDAAVTNTRHVLEHELGHNLGLRHSNSNICENGLLGACTWTEYGDPYDVMGGRGHFNAAQKERLGWLGSKLIDGTHGAHATLEPMAADSPGPKAIKIDTPEDRTFWLEYRQKIDFDAEMPDGGDDGVQVRVTGDGSGGHPDAPSLLDVRPQDGLSARSATLRAGSSWTSPEGYKIAVSSVQPSGATVAVTHAPTVASASTVSMGSGRRYIARVQTYGAASATVQVRYGLTDAYGTTTPFSASGVANADSEAIVYADMPNLVKGKTYHYQAIVRTADGTTTTADQTFTVPAPPDVRGEGLFTVSGYKRYVARIQTFGAPDATVQIEYGTTTDYGSKTPVSEPYSTDSDSEALIHGDIAGVQPDTTYHYRAIITTALGTTTTADKTFTTPQSPRIESDGLFTVSGNKRYVVRASTFGAPTVTVQVEYGETAAYGASTAISDPVQVNAGSEALLYRDLPGLKPGTTYHYRAILRSAKGATYTADRTFVTAAPPRVESDELAADGDDRRYSARVQTFGASSAKVQLEWGTTTAYGSTSAVSSPASVDAASEATVSASMTGLAPETTYHWRAIITTVHGTTRTEDRTFTTPSVRPRVVSSFLGAYDGDERYVARVQTFGAPSVTAQAEYGLTTAYGSTTPVSAPATANTKSEALVSVDMTGLESGKTYHFRVRLVSAKGETVTDDRTFVAP